MTSVRIPLSLARVPLHEISRKVEQLESLGWQEDGRGDPWSASFVRKLDLVQEDRRLGC